MQFFASEKLRIFDHRNVKPGPLAVKRFDDGRGSFLPKVGGMMMTGNYHCGDRIREQPPVDFFVAHVARLDAIGGHFRSGGPHDSI